MTKIDLNKIDPIVKEILEKYLKPEQLAESVWPLERKNKKGELYTVAWIAKHKYLEIIAAKAGITFDVPEKDKHVMECSKDSVAMFVIGRMGDKCEWSTGEASPLNYKQRGKMDMYPYAIAEKRAKDRVILKLIGLHGFVYSEEEADEFKEKTKAQNDTAGLHTNETILTHKDACLKAIEKGTYKTEAFNKQLKYLHDNDLKAYHEVSDKIDNDFLNGE